MWVREPVQHQDCPTALSSLMKSVLIRPSKRGRNALPMSDSVRARYKNQDNDSRGPWQSISALAQAGHGTASQFYTLTAPNGKEHELPEGNCWRYTQQRMTEAIGDGSIWFGKTGNNAPRIKKYLNESGDSGLTPGNDMVCRRSWHHRYRKEAFSSTL